MKKTIIIILFLLSTLNIYSQNKTKANTLLQGKISSKLENNDIKNILTDPKDNFIKNSIDVLLKDIQKINNELEENLSSNIEDLIKENKEYLNQLEKEYRTKLIDEHTKLSELKKSVDEIMKIKDLELKIVDQKINEINKNLKDLSSDDFIKKFKKQLKSQLEKFKKSSIESFEEKLNIKLDTINNER